MTYDYVVISGITGRKPASATKPTTPLTLTPSFSRETQLQSAQFYTGQMSRRKGLPYQDAVVIPHDYEL